MPTQHLLCVQIHKAGTEQAEPRSLPAQVINHRAGPSRRWNPATLHLHPIRSSRGASDPSQRRQERHFPRFVLGRLRTALHSSGTAAPAASAPGQGSSLLAGRKNTLETGLCHGAACCYPWGKHFGPGEQATGRSQA